ncbi:hypothetical protein BDQ12DRAFT_676533 [Crucibulum laeve]|uniref:Uncharacterized protein n=1 Tax=Crucibulum laeve TaxID=68775 RepID=A0A5C3MDC1_9AGAR|nr:hypothetical protein BDQ12DRAFT_676533 [Crucibulum laeve]
MQSLRYLAGSNRRAFNLFFSQTRCLCSSPARRTAAGVPWFIEEDEVIPQSFEHRVNPPHLAQSPQRPSAAPPPPEDAPAPLKALHAQLSDSPYLDTSSLIVARPTPPSPGPPLPLRSPQGRRRRGGTYPGESSYEYDGSIWSWVVMAQVKEGTENRGAIESVIRIVRKTLLGMEPPVTIPPKSRRQMASGWAMVDGGNFAVHVLSKEAREKYFDQQRWNQW